MIYRIFIGLILSGIYLVIFTGNVDWFENFNNTQKAIFDPDIKTLGKAQAGIFFIYLMALASVYLIIFAEEYHKIFIGYYLVFITFAVFYAF